MKPKTSIIMLILITLTISTFCQVELKGVLKKNIYPYKKGDTVQVYAKKTIPEYEISKYLIKKPNKYKYIKSKKIDIISSKLDFWDKVWFEERAESIVRSGWDVETRSMLKQDAKDYINHAKCEELIFKDEFVYDYLMQLIFSIYPHDLYRPKKTHLRPIIIKSHKPYYFTFDDGHIIMTTGLLSNTTYEKELIQILTESIAHIVLEHNLVNLQQQIKSQRNAEILGTIIGISAAAATAAAAEKNDYSPLFDAIDVGIASYFISSAVVHSIGAEYSIGQNKKAGLITKSYMDSLPFDTITDFDYTRKIANVLSYMAWQEYDMMNYNQSIALINKLREVNVATAHDYLLLSKLYRATSDDEASNLKALTFIREAKKISSPGFIELDKEMGILYMRLNEPEDAQRCLERYKHGLIKLKEKGIDVSDELIEINRLLNMSWPKFS